MGVREGSRTGDLRVTEALINKRKVVGAGKEEHVRQEGQTQSGKKVPEMCRSRVLWETEGNSCLSGWVPTG